MDTQKFPIRLRQHVRWLPADMDSPISLFMGMAQNKTGILLESAEVDGRWGRYSVLACDMALTLSCKQGLLELRIEDDRLRPLSCFNGLPFVEGIRGVMRNLDILPDSLYADLPPITRSLCGYFGFGMAGLFNSKLSSVLPPEEAECTLCLPGTLMLFDHLYNKLAQVSLGRHAPVFGAHSSEFYTESLANNAPLDESSIQSTPDGAGYMAAVDAIREMLRNGEAIQVVPSTRFSMPFDSDPITLYRRMRCDNASPYMFFMRFPDITLFGASPEVMVRCTGGRLLTAPIAGTRRRGHTSEEDERLARELLDDPKERAEHMMLVDLGRNDLGRLAKPGSVNVDSLMAVERFSHVMHLTSNVTAELRDGLDAMDVLAATFPAGTVSGAPKLRAMEIIARTERLPRGPYAGCIGWIGLDKDSVHLDTGITIRSMWVRDGKLNWQAGSGIVFDSNPALEWKEVRNKSAIMRKVCTLSGDQYVPSHR
ncbi:MAG: anthranilate synthase component I family protein [Desulfovibrionaceae bacterium]|nr:anthranilate synthase component I family protein [Desulfovibrionaceae bacterium]